MKFDDAPRLSKLPFIVGDIVLLALAWFIAARHPNPVTPLPLFVITGCVVAGIVALMIPFVVNNARDQEDAATSLRHELGEQFKRLKAASDHLQNSTIQLKSIEEIATKNLQAAEKLPFRLQEKITEFNQQLTAAENQDKARLEQELTRLRSGENERLVAAAEQITKSLAGWTGIEAGVKQQIAAATELHEKLAGVLAALESRIAGLQATVEAAVKAAEDISAAPPAPAGDGPIVAGPEPVESTAASPSPAIAKAVSATKPVVLPDRRALLEPVSPYSEPSEAARPVPAMAPEPSSTADPAPALPAVSPSVDPIPVIPEAIPPPAPLSPPAATEALDVAVADVPSAASARDVAPLKSPRAVEPPPAVPATTPIPESPAAGPDKPVRPPSSSGASAPVASPKPRKPRAPGKPKLKATAPAKTAGEPADGPAPVRESPIAAPPPVELIAEPVADEPPPPENFSQIPPEENKPVANPAADGRTRLTVVSYIGIGNKLHLRGEGAGLSWTKGVPLQFVSIGRWRWETEDSSGPVVCRIYKNDKLEAPIGPLTLTPGTEQEVSVTF